MNSRPIDRYIARAALGYALFGVVWILASDHLLAWVLDVDTLTRLSTVKGLLFVVVTAALFAMALRRVQALVEQPAVEVEGFRWSRWQRWPGYLLALVLMLLAIQLRVLMQQLDGDGNHLLLLIFVPSLLVAALLGGLGPGLLATALAVLAAAHDLYWSAAPRHGERSDDLQLLLLAGSGIAVSLISAQLHRAREQSQRQATLSALTLASIADGVLVTDAAGEVLSLNAAAERITGWDADSARGQPLNRIIHCGCELACSFLLDPQGQGSLPCSRLWTRDGKSLPVRVLCSPIRDGGRVFGRVLILHDESERERAQQELLRSRELLAAIVEGSSDSIYVKDLEGRYLLCNRHGAAMIGRTPEQIVGHTDEQLFPPADARLLRENDAAILASGQSRTLEEELDLGEGRKVVFLATKGPVLGSGGQAAGVFGISRDITERIRAERRLAQSRRQLETFIAQAPVSVAMFDRDMRYLVASRHWLDGLGLDGDATVGRCHYELFPDLPERWKALHQRALAGESLRSDLDLWEREDGQSRWLRWAIQPWDDEQGRHGGIIMAYDDLTEQMRLHEQQRIAAVALEAADAIVITDAQGVIQQVNRAYCEVTGYRAEEAVGRRQGDLVRSGRHGADFYRAMWSELAAQGVWRGELWNRRKNGEIYPEFLSITAVRDAEGRVTHYVGVLQDISQRKQAEETISHLAFFDALTDLPNRRLLLDRLRRALQNSERSGQWGALFFIDLDNFKHLNDSRGHDAGDQLLIEVARRLQSCVRQTDTAARLGGDEFVLLLDALDEDAQRAAAQAAAEAVRIAARLSEPYLIQNHPCHSTPSIGITLFHGERDAADVLMKQADLALYQAKAEGKDTVRFFDPAMQVAVDRRSQLEAELRVAVERRQFHLYYQLQLHRDGRIVGCEALLRWQREDGSIVGPNEFIPLAEDTGLILPMGLQALQQACAQLALWARDPRMAGLSLAVNVSARQFRSEGFVDSVREALQQSGADPRLLKLELTESLLLDQVELAIARMHELRALGVVFSLDDFGTGYSSLAYLKRLPLEQLKIDRSFVADLLTDANDAVIARAVIALAHSLGLVVVAEGVESEPIWAQLRADGCDVGQGYLFSRPLPAEQIQERMQACG